MVLGLFKVEPPPERGGRFASLDSPCARLLGAGAIATLATSTLSGPHAKCARVSTSRSRGATSSTSTHRSSTSSSASLQRSSASLSEAQLSTRCHQARQRHAHALSWSKNFEFRRELAPSMFCERASSEAEDVHERSDDVIDSISGFAPDRIDVVHLRRCRSKRAHEG